MANGAYASRHLPGRHRSQPVAATAGVWQIGAANDAHAANQGCTFYQLFLQTPQAEVALGHDLRGTFRGQFYALSGDRPPPAGGGFAGGMVPRERALLPDPASLPAWVAESDIDVYVKEFTRSGFHGPLAW